MEQNPEFAIEALEYAKATAIETLDQKRDTLEVARRDEERYEQQLADQKKVIAQYEQIVRVIEDKVAEFQWAINLISRATTVDKTFLTEVWSEHENERSPEN